MNQDSYRQHGVHVFTDATINPKKRDWGYGVLVMSPDGNIKGAMSMMDQIVLSLIAVEVQAILHAIRLL